MPDAYEHLRKFPLNVVLAALGFETFKYRKNGTEGYGACPIHGSKKNTTCFSFNDEGLWRCFSCSAKGKGSIDLCMAVKKCGFKDAVTFLEGITASIEAKPVQESAREPTAPITENPAFKGTYEKYAVPSPWLEARGFTPATLKRFGVFQYDNPARQSAYRGKILLPVRRWDGELVAYLARNPEPKDGEAKYVWPKGFQKSLEVFGAFQLKEKAPIRVLYLVESPFCVLKFSQLGFEAVSCFGWSVSPEQAACLARLARGCIYLPDADKRAEAVRIAGILSQHVWTKCPPLPDDVNDPEQMSVSQIQALT